MSTNMRKVWLVFLVNLLIQEGSSLSALTSSATRLFSFTKTTAETSTTTHSCRVCLQTFVSRNAFFRHLHNTPSCSHVLNNNEPSTSVTLTTTETFRIAFRFGYYYDSYFADSKNNNNYIAATAHPSRAHSPAEQAGYCIQRLLLKNMSTSTLDYNVSLISSTQSSCAQMRPNCLQQEEDCAAAGDVLVVTGTLSSLSSNPMTAATCSTTWMMQALQSMYLQEIVHPVRNNHQLHLRVECCKLLDDRHLHAERSCTQYVYHYLMPLAWLVDVDEEGSCEEWVRVKRQPGKNSRPPSLVRLKQALRSAESPRLDPNDLSPSPPLQSQSSSRRAAGRFGGLAFKTRLPWHNFCDPSLMGQASPNNEPVWRCVDRARIIQFIDNDNTTTAVLEFRGDAFLRHQIRYMVGTAVAVANRWLPPDTFALCTKPDRIISPLPRAPAGRLYLVGTRFHFEEMRTSGKSLFESNIGGPVAACHIEQENVEWIQTALLSQKKSNEEQRLEQEWLQNLKKRMCPSTVASLLESSTVEYPCEEAEIRLLTLLSPPPEEYKLVLSHLRDIVAQEKWPETSAARSSVIRGGMLENKEDGSVRSKGSFTVLNPLLVDSQHAAADGYPLGNRLFPELVQAVFALEQVLSQHPQGCVTLDHEFQAVRATLTPPRRPSSHCAINCNAEFTPHVDSGRGAGQTISMIVGLGDYAGGDLMIEGKAYDIRFRPLEFDGWKLRHWTRRFTGERFSLVWFTPE